MITGNEPAFSVADTVDTANWERHIPLNLGLTIRQYYAGLAMQGLIASIGQHDVTEFHELANDAVMAADALINELNKSD